MPTVKQIIKNAVDSRYTGQQWINRMNLYESFKRDIVSLNLDDTQYEQAIQGLADALGV